MIWACAACTSNSEKNSPLRLIIEQPPTTLNPRAALDAWGQRIDALIFRGLTQIDSDLNPQPDLADHWEIADGGKTWKFVIRTGLRDQSGESITPLRIANCLDEYRMGKPTSPLAAAFPYWRKTRSDSSSVILELDRPDPYLARNVSALRYFVPEGGTPCHEPEANQKVIGSGEYRPATWELAPDSGLLLKSQNGDIQISFVRDETTRALRLLHGDADAVQTGITLTKTRWLQKNHSDQFRFLERKGVVVSYLAFNLSDPILSKLAVRRAIAEAIPRQDIVDHKLLGFCQLAGSFLAPELPESYQSEFRFDPSESEKLLDQAGYPRGPNGIRLTLRYKTTPVREGLETALIFQDALRKVGIQLNLDPVEPTVFLASIRKGAFQMYSSRWVGVSDASILYRTLHTGESNNRAHYHNKETDQLLDLAATEMDLAKRTVLMKQVQQRMTADLPYFPLWYWNTTLIVRKEFTGLDPGQLSLSGGLRPLTQLRRK